MPKDSASKNFGNKVRDTCNKREKELEEIYARIDSDGEQKNEIAVRVSRNRTSLLSREGLSTGRSNSLWALSLPTYSCWVCPKCKAQSASYLGHFSELCLQIGNVEG